MDKCHEVMTEDPVCCLAGDSVETVAQWMRTLDIGALPVVESHQTKKLIGIVTDRDLAVRVVGQGREIENTTIGDVMTPDPLTCRPFDYVDTALEIMTRYQVRRVPIVDNYGKVLGIIAQADLATRLHNPAMTAAVVTEISRSTQPVLERPVR